MSEQPTYKPVSEAWEGDPLKILGNLEAHRLNRNLAGMQECERQLRTHGYTGYVELPKGG